MSMYGTPGAADVAKATTPAANATAASATAAKTSAKNAAPAALPGPRKQRTSFFQDLNANSYRLPSNHSACCRPSPQPRPPADTRGARTDSTSQQLVAFDRLYTAALNREDPDWRLARSKPSVATSTRSGDGAQAFFARGGAVLLSAADGRPQGPAVLPKKDTHRNRLGVADANMGSDGVAWHAIAAKKLTAASVSHNDGYLLIELWQVVDKSSKKDKRPHNVLKRTSKRTIRSTDKLLWHETGRAFLKLSHRKGVEKVELYKLNSSGTTFRRVRAATTKGQFVAVSWDSRRPDPFAFVTWTAAPESLSTGRS